MPIPADQTNFPGLRDLVKQSDGRANSSTGPLRIFLIHGIGVHQPTWGQAYLSPLVQEMGPGWSMNIVADHNVQWDGAANTFVGSVRVYQISDGTKIRMVAYQLTWSPLTTPFKVARFSTDITQSRPLINQDVRGVIDENLSDVVLYLSGFDNNVLNETAELALQSFYRGDWDPTGISKDSIARSPVVVITESLGSTIFMDSVNALAQQSSGSNDDLRTFLANNQLVFMMANQLNLLDMPEPAPSGVVPSTQPAATENSPPPQRKRHRLRSYLTLRYNALTQKQLAAPEPPDNSGLGKPSRGFQPLFFVAFNDPYDVLSYTVTNDDVSEFQGIQMAAVDNFAPRNTTWDWLGLYEDIATAHTGYSANPHVTDMVVKGYSQGIQLPSSR